MAITPEAAKTRLGFHYFPDTEHYRDNDLRRWLPELKSLNAGWLSLVAPSERAIPESFLRGLLADDIEPILHFLIHPTDLPAVEDFRLLFETYADWGVRYAVLFDRPNRRQAWAASDWSQQDLVERFLDLFLPLAECAVRSGLIPVFPPLEPGGDYWDTAFLQTALSALRRRADPALLNGMAVAALGRAGNRPLNWGAGGPERWPGARPYITTRGEEDQCGFRTFDWYLPVIQAILGHSLPVIVLGAGSQIGDHSDPNFPPVDDKAHTLRNLSLVKLVEDSPPNLATRPLDPLPQPIICTCFWLLAAGGAGRHEAQAWFRPDGRTRPIVGALRQWRADQRSNEQADQDGQAPRLFPSQQIIAHYLLLPTYPWGIADWHLDVIRAYVKERRPTIGFSLVEAAQATRVTVVGGAAEFPEAALEDLRASGCSVERIEGDGTTIAMKLGNGSGDGQKAENAAPIQSRSRELS